MSRSTSDGGEGEGFAHIGGRHPFGQGGGGGGGACSGVI